MNDTQFVSVIGAIIVSVLIVIGFVFVFALAYMNRDMDTVKVLSGIIAGAMTSVVGYWIGSSMGSRAKDGVIQQKSDEVLALRVQAPQPNFPKTP